MCVWCNLSPNYTVRGAASDGLHMFHCVKETSGLELLRIAMYIPDTNSIEVHNLSIK